VIDPRVDIELGQPRVDVFGPSLAPVGQQIGPVPVANLRAEPLFADLAHGQHHMRMRLGLAVGANIPMHIEIRDHAARDELTGHKVAGEADAFDLVQLARDGELDLAGELRVLAHFGGFDRVPQRFAIGKMLGRAVGQQDFGMNDAGLVGEVVMPVEPLVMEP